MFIICKESATEAEVLRDLIANFAFDGADQAAIYFCYESREKAEYDLVNQIDYLTRKSIKDCGFVIREVKLSFL
jgi:hypothetical protein